MDVHLAVAWLLLVISLPTSGGTARMRIWRALKTLGCVALRDGAYLLPSGADRARALRDLGDECDTHSKTDLIACLALHPLPGVTDEANPVHCNLVLGGERRG